jgi:hypothetical protein
MGDFRNDFDDFIFRVKDRTREKIEDLEYRLHLTSRWGKLSLRLAGLAVFAFVIAHFLPSSADTISNTPVTNQQIQNDTATIDSGNSGSGGAGGQGSSGDSSTVPSEPVVVYLDSGTVVATEPVITGETPIVHVPSVIKVDPRSSRINLPLINGGGGSTVQICMTASSPSISLSSSGPVFPVYQETTMVFKTETGTITNVNAPIQVPSIAGNGTNQLIVTGTLSNLMSTINGTNGLLAFSHSGGLGGKFVTLSVTPLSQPSTNPAYCSKGTSQTIAFQNLGLEISNSVGKIHLHS